MKYSSFFSGMKRDGLAIAKRHQTVIVLLVLLSTVAMSSRVLLRADLTGGASTESTDSSSSERSEELRSCSSVGTIFMDSETLKDARELFQGRMSEVTIEREQYLLSPSQWTCLRGAEPTMEKLKALATALPGWKYRTSAGSVAVRPVTFASFDSIVSEFEREYECKLGEFEGNASGMIQTNRDLDTPKQYCCNDSNACVQKIADDSCRSGATVSEHPDCQSECETIATHADIAFRVPSFVELQRRERDRARFAIEQTVHTMRSFETSYAYAKQLTCFQRASLDLKNELSLLADTMSCMPRIWDALTSLHDRR